MGNSIFNISPSTVILLAMTLIFIFAIFILVYVFGINVLKLITDTLASIGNLIGVSVKRREDSYARDIAIGKINKEHRRHKTYRFMNDLIIDLDIKKRGITPYSFIIIIIAVSLVVDIYATQLLFSGNIIMGIILFPVSLALIVCVAYTKANMAHNARISAVIEAENIISNSIADGVVLAVKNNIDLLPKQVKVAYEDFVLNVEKRNIHVKPALNELNNQLGSMSDDFIKKCIQFELEEADGSVLIFQEVVELNNLKNDLRIKMKYSIDAVTYQIVISAAMIFAFLGGVIAIFDVVRNFYFNTIAGQIILMLDILILVGESVYITYLRAREL